MNDNDDTGLTANHAMNWQDIQADERARHASPPKWTLEWISNRTMALIIMAWAVVMALISKRIGH